MRIRAAKTVLCLGAFLIASICASGLAQQQAAPRPRQFRFDLVDSLTWPEKDGFTPLSVYRVGFSKDGRSLVWFASPWGDVGEVCVWDIKAKQYSHRLIPSRAIKFDRLWPDGPLELRTFFVARPHACFFHQTTRGFEIQDDFALSWDQGKRSICLKDLEPQIRISRVAISHDNLLMAGAYHDKSVAIWNLESGKRLWKVALPEMPELDAMPERIAMNEMRALIFDAKGRFLAAAIDSATAPGKGSVLVWDTSSGQRVLQTEEEGRIFDVAFTPAGALISVGGTKELDSGTISIRTGESFAKVRTIEGAPCGIYSVAVLNENQLVTGGWKGNLVLWDMATGNRLATRQVAKGKGSQPNPTVITFDPKLNLVASGSWDSKVRIWRIVSQ